MSQTALKTEPYLRVVKTHTELFHGWLGAKSEPHHTRRDY